MLTRRVPQTDMTFSLVPTMVKVELKYNLRKVSWFLFLWKIVRLEKLKRQKNTGDVIYPAAMSETSLFAMLFTISGPYRLPLAWPRPSWASSFLPMVITLPASVRQTVCFVLMATSTIRARIEWMRVGTKAVLTCKINWGLNHNDVITKNSVNL